MANQTFKFEVLELRVLIVGGAGFIGCNLANYFLGKGHEVIIFDNFSRKGCQQNVAWLRSKSKKISVVRADICHDFHKLKLLSKNVAALYHLAAQVAVTTSVKEPRHDFMVNALGTFNVLEAARQANTNPAVIYASTNKVYGGMEDVKVVEKDNKYAYKDYPLGISESRFLDFHSPYGCSKGAGDQYVRDYARIYGLNSVVFRQSCIYGERQFGIEDQGWVAWFIIATALNKPLTVYGNGKQVRDVLYIGDLVKAFEIATKKISQARGKIYNLGGGPKNTLSLLELISLLENHFQRKIEPRFSDWRPGDQPVYVSDISKAKEELNWQPETSAKAGVEKLCHWVEQNKKMLAKMF